MNLRKMAISVISEMLPGIDRTGVDVGSAAYFDILRESIWRTSYNTDELDSEVKLVLDRLSTGMFNSLGD